MITLEPDKGDQDYLGKRTERVTYCPDCGECEEWCKCGQPAEEDEA